MQGFLFVGVLGKVLAIVSGLLLLSLCQQILKV
jgi:hypothetical protein